MKDYRGFDSSVAGYFGFFWLTAIRGAYEWGALRSLGGHAMLSFMDDRPRGLTD